MKLKTLFIMLFLGMSMMSLESCVGTKYKVSYTRDPESPTKIFIPSNIEEAMHELNHSLPKKLKYEIRDLKKEGDLARYHFSLGLWMRNNWGLWGGSRLAHYFYSFGIHHPDDMSAIILGCFWRDLNGFACDVEQLAKPYRELLEKMRRDNKIEDKKCHIHPQLSVLEGRDPVQDAQRHLQKGDRKFLGVYGFTLMVPGVLQDSKCIHQRNIRVIPDTTDGPRCMRHSILQRVAHDYAKKYNDSVLKSRLQEEGLDCRDQRDPND